MNSPYTESNIEVTRIDYDNCVSQFGPEGGPGRDFLLVDGTMEAGSPQGESVLNQLKGTLAGGVLQTLLHVENPDRG